MYPYIYIHIQIDTCSHTNMGSEVHINAEIYSFMHIQIHEGTQMLFQCIDSPITLRKMFPDARTTFSLVARS